MEQLKVLIPTDFSVQSEYAYLMVKKLKEKIVTEIHFLHVLEVPDTVTLDHNGKVHTCGEIDVNYIVSQKEIIDRKFDDLKRLYSANIQTHLVFGKITDALIRFSETHQFDLIVMGTKGSHGLKEKLSGSETQMIARKSNIPLLSLMCDRSDLTINNILLVHNFNDPAEDNLALLKKLATAFGARVHQLQVVSRQSEQEKAGLLRQMDLHAQAHGLTNYENHVLTDSDIERGVIHFNQMHEVDLVCIGTHGKGGLFHASAAEKIINHVFKPIISFHLKN